MKKISILVSIILAASVVLLSSCGSKKPVLRICVWSDYVPPSTILDFEREYGCRVIVNTFPNNEMLYSDMKVGGAKYDIILPSGYMALEMKKEGMIIELDHKFLPNSKFVDKDFLTDRALDKKMEYSVPYMISYTLLAYDSARTKAPEASWNAIGNPALKKRVCVLADIRELMGAALKVNGYSINSTNDAEIEKAHETLLKWRENIAKFDSESYKAGLVTGEFMLVQGYMGDLIQIMQDKPSIKLLFPKEGMMTAVDNWSIPSTCENLDLAYAFINHMLKPQIAVKNMDFAKYDAANTKAKEIMPKEMYKKIFIDVPPEVLKKSEILLGVGESMTKYNKIWDEL